MSRPPEVERGALPVGLVRARGGRVLHGGGSAVALTAAVPQWLSACSKWQRGDMYDQMLKDAQKPAVVNQLNSAAWTRKTIKTWFENNWRSHAPPAPPEETEDA